MGPMVGPMGSIVRPMGAMVPINFENLCLAAIELGEIIQYLHSVFQCLHLHLTDFQEYMNSLNLTRFLILKGATAYFNLQCPFSCLKSVILLLQLIIIQYASSAILW